ncbi:unnamed protein product [Rhizoctonia solani]|uniref:AB hydrolase-1 domain-containing protein n=1 Tax=Rhizoctonia solani TaxID=456999 RepID=A0A8H3D587_9AGAM|nr:unnamed protein product [Rhizoctonia solani]
MSGVETIQGSIGELMMKSSGGHYDVVSWDPRGVGKSTPRSTCFRTTEEDIAFWNGSLLLNGPETRGSFTSQTDLNQFYGQIDEVDDLLTRFGKKCIAYNPNAFRYVGTAATVRDMVAMHDIIEGPNKPINFWGISYGTVIGMYFVNMFPDRVGRVVLDGAVNPKYWADRPAYENWPDLAQNLKKAAVVLSNPASFNATKYKRWLTTPANIVGNQHNPRNQPPAITTDETHMYANEAITCGDSQDARRVTTKEVFDDIIKITREVSHMFGPIAVLSSATYCHRWPVRAVERYTGPWNKKLSNPILVLSNKVDPVTPYLSAKHVADAFGSSAVLVEQDAFGHSSLAMHSNCTSSVLERYFLHNQLPQKGLLCETDQELFPKTGIPESIVSDMQRAN